MARDDQRNPIEEQWRAQALAWGQDPHDRERPIVARVLGSDENILGLVGCVWGPVSAWQAQAGLMGFITGFLRRAGRLQGVAVITERNVHLAAKKGMNELASRFPLSSITAVTRDRGIITITGRSIHDWQGMGLQDPFQLRDVHGGQETRFAELVERMRTSGAPAFTLTPVDERPGMTREERIDAQWQARTLAGANRQSYDGERRKLYEMLADDENIEYWVGGRWGRPGDFDSLVGALVRSGSGPGGRNRTGRDGVAVATDRRVILLDAGFLGSTERELPYADIARVEYNDGMIASGVKFLGEGIDDYEFYFDHENRSSIKDAPLRLVECIQQHLGERAGDE